MSDFADSISGNDLNLENLKRQVAYTFLDAYGNYDGADILFDLIVKATEQRIIKLLEESLYYADWEGIFWDTEKTGKSGDVNVQDLIALIKGEK